MTKKKVTKKVTKNSKPKVTTTKKSPVKVVKQITTIEENKSGGHWTKTITVDYIKPLLCPKFLGDKVILYMAAVPLIILIIAVLWKVTAHE